VSRIVSVTTRIATLEIENPIRTPTGTGLRFVDNVVVDVETADGTRGQGYVWVASLREDAPLGSNSTAELVETAIRHSAPIAVGEDVLDNERIWTRLKAPALQLGEGLVSIAQSGIDMAVWDARCKVMGQPLYRVLGGARDAAPVYGNLIDAWAGTLDDLADLARDLVAAGGFRSLKMRLGLHPHEPEEADVERVLAVQEAVGPDIGIMIDVVGAWTFDEALRRCRRFDELGLLWIEDPLPINRPDQLERLCAELRTPVAAGELGFNHRELRDLMERGALDIFIFEPMRIGGVTGAIKAARMAEEYNIPVCCHVYSDLAAQLLAGLPNGHMVEYLPWWGALYESPMVPVDGFARPSDEPGIGMALSETALERMTPSLAPA
jgi:L-alanine-DL-glutamate epimerase-like enolase superfamily enzyme